MWRRQHQPGSDLSNGLFYQWGRKDPFGSSNYEGKLKAMYDMAGAEVTRTVEPVSVTDNMPNAHSESSDALFRCQRR